MAITSELNLQKAYLLHSRPYRDNRLLVNLLTEENGHVSAVVYVGKGGSKGKSANKKGLLQPFAKLDVELKGNGALKNLSKVENAEKSLPLESDYLFSGFYLNELMVRLLPENIELESLFEFYQTSINQLANKDQIEPILRQFELTLLTELGLSLDFSILDLQQNQNPNNYDIREPHFDCHYYLPEQGFVLANFAGKTPAYNTEHLRMIGDGNFHQADVLLTFKRLMRQVLQGYLGNKPLNSRKLFSNKFKNN